ncbi:hypothetical protein [Leptospira noguchii]|uniref:hypothetical protein n=1 Tax=Leptospira noguchii TaxID=28182 RepID=UPI0012DAC4C1|nr:hypothetical protein [Leptospira noguchii]
MTNQKNYISVLLIVLLVFLAGCKEKQDQAVEIKDKYALPPGYTGILNFVPYDFEYENLQWVGVDASAIEKFLGIQRTIFQGHCGILDFEKKTLLVRITGTKKDRVLKFLYLGNHRFALLNNENRGFVGKLDEDKREKINDYYFYPLSEITDTNKIDNLDPFKKKGYEFSFSNIDGSKYKSMNDCEQETIEQEKVQQSIDEEHERVKGDLAPP